MPMKKGPAFAFVLAATLATSLAFGGDHGASSAHSQHTGDPPGLGQPKRVDVWAAKQILLGEPERAEEYLRKVVKAKPERAQPRFVLAASLAHQGEMAQADRQLRTALERGLPPGQPVAGPPELTEPLKETEAYRRARRAVEKARGGLTQGPRLGAVSDRTVRLWVRAAEAGTPVRVAYAEATGETKPRLSERAVASREDDRTAVVKLRGLRPDTRYRYRVVVGEETPNAGEVLDGRKEGHFHFRTFPERGEPADFRIAFGGGAGFTPPNERVWETIQAAEPRCMLMLGDNVYSDDPKSPAIQRYCYYRRQSEPRFRRLGQTVPLFAIWDDHDFSNNDSWGGPKPHKPAWKPAVWDVFRENWANPGYGGGEDRPGCWYRFSIGDVAFFMLDTRYYRTSPRLPPEERSMLGEAQKAWLKKGVAESEATFKVLVSSVPWDYRTKGDSPDTWNGYKHERRELFTFLRDERIEGVVLMSADRHRSDAWRIDESAGKPDGLYDLYEVNSSRLTNAHVHGEKDAAIFSYNDTQSFGLVRFNTRADDPRWTYKVRTIDGDTPHTLTVRLSDLTFDADGG